MGGARVLLGEVQGVEGLKVSVIIPCVKRDELFDRCVRSIERSVAAARGCDVEHELVVVEGVSPVGAARNEGLRRATGDWIAWVDADDEVLQDWFADISRILKTRPDADVLVTDVENVGWEGCADCEWEVPPGAVPVERFLFDFYHGHNLTVNVWQYVTRRVLWKGLEFDESVCMGEDYQISHLVLRRASNCIRIGRKLYRYHCNPGSLMNGGCRIDADEQDRVADRRLELVTSDYRRAAVWGVGTDRYWIADLAALSGQDCERARRARSWIRRHFLSLLVESVFGRHLSFCDRRVWPFRFLSAALDCWWVQVRHARKRRACR